MVRGQVLVIDDDSGIRDLLRAALETVNTEMKMALPRIC